MRVCGAEHSDNGESDSGGDVHRAGIVAEEDVALGEQGGKIGDGGFSGEVDGRTAKGCGNRRGDWGFGGSAEEDDVGIGMRGDGIQCLGKTIGWPALGGTVGSASTDSDAAGGGPGTGFEESEVGALACRRRDVQGDERFVGERIQPARATKEFEVVELLVCRNFAGLGDGDGLGQEEASAIASIADALRDVGAPGEPGGVKCVLQEQRGVEFAGTEIMG